MENESIEPVAAVLDSDVGGLGSTNKVSGERHPRALLDRRPRSLSRDDGDELMALLKAQILRYGVRREEEHRRREEERK